MSNYRTGFLYIDPIKQGLKHNISCSEVNIPERVFIHRSNKTRIETHNFGNP